MPTIIKDAKKVNLGWASISRCLDVPTKEVKDDDVLIDIDIVTAINYYGITELLDTIGERQLKSHLKDLQSMVSSFNHS